MKDYCVSGTAAHTSKCMCVCVSVCTRGQGNVCSWILCGGYCLKMLTVVAVEGVQCLLAVSADLRDAQCK